MPWTFYDFRSERGENLIRAWTNGEGKAAKARLNVLRLHLSQLDRMFTRADNVGQLRKDGPCHGQGFIELLIKVQNVEYRPIGWYGPDKGSVTLLIGATERDGKLNPRNVCEQAINRK